MKLWDMKNQTAATGMVEWRRRLRTARTLCCRAYPSIYIDMITPGARKDSGDNGPGPRVLWREKDINVLRRMERNGEVEERRWKQYLGGIARVVVDRRSVSNVTESQPAERCFADSPGPKNAVPRRHRWF
jgi:hypothetical protein